jgi:uncharacterized metal-binding protein YceD (DUF177 family)
MTQAGDGSDGLHYEISAVKLPRDGMPVRFEANERELAALARQLDIVAVDVLKVDLRATPWRRDGVQVQGSIRARVQQESVVSLEPLDRSIDETLKAVFVPEGSKLARVAAPSEHELHIDPEGDDPPEVFQGDRIDLGPYIAEALALALYPYPRAPGESFDEVDTDPEPDAGRRSAFGALSALVPPDGKDGK